MEPIVVGGDAAAIEMSVGVDSVRISVRTGRGGVRVGRVASGREIGWVVEGGGRVGDCEGGH